MYCESVKISLGIRIIDNDQSRRKLMLNKRDQHYWNLKMYTATSGFLTVTFT